MHIKTAFRISKLPKINEGDLHPNYSYTKFPKHTDSRLIGDNHLHVIERLEAWHIPLNQDTYMHSYYENHTANKTIYLQPNPYPTT